MKICNYSINHKTFTPVILASTYNFCPNQLLLYAVKFDTVLFF